MTFGANLSGLLHKLVKSSVGRARWACVAVVEGFWTAQQGLCIIFDYSLPVQLHRFSLIGVE